MSFLVNAEMKWAGSGSVPDLGSSGRSSRAIATRLWLRWKWVVHSEPRAPRHECPWRCQL